jgi:hypothetical protein
MGTAYCAQTNKSINNGRSAAQAARALLIKIKNCREFYILKY